MCSAGGRHERRERRSEPLDPPASPRRRSLLQSHRAGCRRRQRLLRPVEDPMRAWAQAGGKKPLVIGLTMDASGQYGASGGEERLGAMMAIKEFNEKGGVLGRPSRRCTWTRRPRPPPARAWPSA